ncbi:ARM repeat superfamily protein isoform 2 [Theobroma cacao]|uniref:RING-type E3 ubiquitin transferase n=1 Tax=Theobroma cacao TaxID=3641 RepID=A0A061EB91_THECC|nr:ARM repeat superfamily protein isoform 2 [Theobroma cacao]
MSSMDYRFGIEDVGVAILQELWNRVALQTVELAKETRDVVLEKDSFREFSRSVSELNTLLQALNVRKIEAAMGSEFTKAALEKLNGQLRKALKIIKDCKSGSRLRFLLHSHSVLSQMQALVKEIAATISSFQLINLDIAVNLKSMNNQIINNLNLMEFRMAAATETIASEIQNSITQSSRNRENAVKLLEKIAEAVGVNVNAALVQNELALLKQEKQEMEVQKKQAEALQLSQLIQLLYSAEIVSRPQNEETYTYLNQYLIGSFICPLCNEMMLDPVAVFCGHSFERKAIQQYFNSGKKNCPSCREELQSLELTPNVNLRSSIEEWKKRDMDWKFQAAVPGINSNDHLRKNKALEDMQVLVEIPQYAAKAAEEGLIPKFVESLKDTRLNTRAAVKCLYCLAKYCDDQKVVANSDPKFRIQFLHLLIELSNKSKTAQNLIRSNTDAVNHLFSCLDSDQPSVRIWAMKLIQCVSEGHPDGVPLPSSPVKQTAINTLASILTYSPDFEERSIAAGIISQLPKDDIDIDEILRKSDALKAIHEVICSSDEEFGGIGAPTNQDKSLLENALAALLRFTEPSKPELQRQVGELELYPSLVRVLSSGSSLAKQRTAIALAQLSRSTSLSVSDASIRAEQANSIPLLHMMKLFPDMSWCCSASTENEISCPVHGVACSQRHTFCLVKADAVRPLLQTLSDTNSGVAEAALMALETLLEDHSTLSHATAAIVDSQGVVAILQVLEKGSISAKTTALDLFHKILNHSQISDPLFQRSEGILIQLLHEDALRKKVALVLKQMNVLPEQSSYF